MGEKEEEKRQTEKTCGKNISGSRKLTENKY